MNIDGKIYKAIKALYTKNTAFVKVNNDVNTDWFDVPNGVRQGDPLSPNLFNIFINELVKYLKSLKIGIDIGHDLKISVLLYADDIILLGSYKAELQAPEGDRVPRPPARAGHRAGVERGGRQRGTESAFGPTIMVQYVGT